MNTLRYSIILEDKDLQRSICYGWFFPCQIQYKEFEKLTFDSYQGLTFVVLWILFVLALLYRLIMNWFMKLPLLWKNLYLDDSTFTIVYKHNFVLNYFFQ